MNIFFDMDLTLLGLDGSLRPGAHDLMRRLKDDGHTLYVWSGVGIRWPEVRRLGLEAFITDCFDKPLDSLVVTVPWLPTGLKPDIAIDDHPGIPAVFGGIWVRPHLAVGGVDDEMHRVYALIAAHAHHAALAEPAEEMRTS